MKSDLLKALKRESVKIVLSCVLLTSFCLLLTGCKTHHSLWSGSSLQYGAEGSDDSLLVVQNIFNRYGYCDITGKIIIDPQYMDARPFFEGLAAVKKGDRYGYIDRTGKTVIPFKYYEALDFHNGKALVGTELEPYSEVYRLKCSIIDKAGNVLEETKYHNIYNYSEDMQLVYDDTNNAKYLDANYKNIDFKLQSGYFSDGLATFVVDDDKVSYMNKAGNLAFAGVFYQAKLFSGGLAAVLPDEKTKLWGYITKTGEVAIAPQYLEAGGFGEGLACVETAVKRWIIIDTSGKEVCTVQDSINRTLLFSEGLCAVGKQKPMNKEYYYLSEDERYNWGFMDTTGKLVIDFKFDMVTPFKNGIAQVLLDGKIGYIDKTGKYIWEPK